MAWAGWDGRAGFGSLASGTSQGGQAHENELKLLASKRDVPYQSLMKMFLEERIEQELRSFSLARDHDPAPRVA